MAVAESWWASLVAAVAPYAVLLRLLIDDRVTGEEFEVVFCRFMRRTRRLGRRRSSTCLTAFSLMSMTSALIRFCVLRSAASTKPNFDVGQ
jgi:hypothetical protein